MHKSTINNNNNIINNNNDYNFSNSYIALLLIIELPTRLLQFCKKIILKKHD